MNQFLVIVLATVGASWLWHNRREQVLALARDIRQWAEDQWDDPVARKRAVLGVGVACAGLGVVYLGGKVASALDRLGRTTHVAQESPPPAEDRALPPTVLIQPPSIMGGGWSDGDRDPGGGYSGPGGRYGGLAPADPDSGETLAGGLGGLPARKPEPEPGGPELAGWLDHIERPDPNPELPEVTEGLLWSARAIPATGAEPNVGRIALDPDGFRAYSYSHDSNNAAIETGVFVTQWRLDDGSMVWSQRMNGDLPPVFNAANSHLFVYDEQPIQGLSHRPVPGNSALHPIWTLNRIMGGITGPVPTFPLTALVLRDGRRGRWIEGVCPRDRDSSGVDYSLVAFTNAGKDYFPGTYDQGFRYVEQASGVRASVRRHLLPASADVIGYGHLILSASRLEPLVRVWDTSLGNLGGQSGVYRGHHRAVEFIHARDYTALTADRTEIHCWESKAPGKTTCMAPLPRVAWTVMDVSPGFDYAFLGTERGELFVYDLTHGAFVGEPIRAHDGAVQDIAVSHDWRRVLTVGADGMLKCWGMPGLGPHAAPVAVPVDAPARAVVPEPVAEDAPARGAGGDAPEPTEATPRKHYSGEFFSLPDFESAISWQTLQRVPILDLHPPDGRESAAREYSQFRARHLAKGGRLPTPEELEAIDRQLARLRDFDKDKIPPEEEEELVRMILALYPGGRPPGTDPDQTGHP